MNNHVNSYVRYGAIALSVLTVTAMYDASPRTSTVLRVHVTTGESGTIARVYTNGNARLALDNETPAVRKDTLRLAPPLRLVVDVSDGDVHFDADRGGLAVSVEPTAALPNGLAAAGHHVVLRQGGTQIFAQDLDKR